MAIKFRLILFASLQLCLQATSYVSNFSVEAHGCIQSGYFIGITKVCKYINIRTTTYITYITDTTYLHTYTHTHTYIHTYMPTYTRYIPHTVTLRTVHTLRALHALYTVHIYNIYMTYMTYMTQTTKHT